MGELVNRQGRRRLLAGAVSVCSLAAGAVAMPAAVRAVDLAGSAVEIGHTGLVSFIAKGGTFTPASVDPRVAALVASRHDAGAEPMRFTPAAQPGQDRQSVTVAVRIDSAKLVNMRRSAGDAADPGKGSVRVSPVRYDLGLSRGYAAFAQPEPKMPSLRRIDMPDLAEYAPGVPSAGKPGRFDARLALEESTQQRTAGPRTIADAGEQSVDLGGSYRVTRNIDLTAGLRYSQERDRLQRIDQSQDSQAVYVGTRFRF